MYGSGRGQAPFEPALCGLSQKTKRLIRIAWFPRATLRATQYVVPGDMSIFFVFFMQPRFLCTQTLHVMVGQRPSAHGHRGAHPAARSAAPACRLAGRPTCRWRARAARSPTSLPPEIYQSAGRGELRKVASWLRKGGLVDALGPASTEGGQTETFGLLHAAARNGQLEMTRELLMRGASVDLQDSLGTTALMQAAAHGHPSILLLLLQHSTNPDLQCAVQLRLHSPP